MQRAGIFVALLSILVCAGWLAAAETSIGGSWDCVSTTPGGGEMKWTLTIKEEGGKLVGTAGSEEGDIPLNDVKFDKNTLTFKVVLNSETYEVQLKVSGTTLDGSWKGGGETGSIKGNKKT